MKPKKKAVQKNVCIDEFKYLPHELINMLMIPGVFKLSWGNGSLYRISLDCVKSLDVALDEFGYYTNIATLKSGETIYIEL